MTAALTGIVYLTTIYRVITIDDVVSFKLRFQDIVSVNNTTSSSILSLYNSQYFYVKAIITRNIDNSFIYELPNIKANTITRYTNNTGF